MESWIVVLLVIAALAGIVAFVVIRAKKKKREGKERFDPSEPYTELSVELQRKVIDTNREGRVSPGGVPVASVVPIPDIALKAIDEAIKLRILVMRRKFPAWTRGLNLNEWIYLLVEPDGIAPNAQVPYLSVGGVMSAGTIGRGTKPMVLLPHFGGIGWTKISDFFGAALAEGEHYSEFLNEPNGRFLEFVGANDKHYHDEPTPEEWATVSPDILPQVRGLMSAKRGLSLPCGLQK
jgi:hypothetical protein